MAGTKKKNIRKNIRNNVRDNNIKKNAKKSKDKNNTSHSQQILNNIKYSFAYLNSIKALVLISFLAIFLTSIASYQVNVHNEVFDKTIDTLKGYATSLDNGKFIDIMSFIFFNNVKASFMVMCLGLIPFFPILVNISNGIIIGIVMRTKVDATNNAFLILALLPHGIFEIPAICISTALGLAISMKLLKIGNISKERSFKEIILQSLIIFVTVVIPLLLIAAFIETFIFRMRL